MGLRLFVKAFSSTLALLCAAIGADSPNDLIAKGDACDQKFQAAEALQFYLPAEKPQPTNVRVLVRVARQYRYLMADATTRDDKLRLAVSSWIMHNARRHLLLKTPRRSSPSLSAMERCCRSWVRHQPRRSSGSLLQSQSKRRAPQLI